MTLSKNHDELKITLVSELAELIGIPEVPPISEEGLQALEKVMKRGLVLHQSMGIQLNERALPLHIHPTIILALIQEVRRARQKDELCGS